jgi:dihydropyrimidinase
MEFDLVIRGGTVVTAGDVGRSDVGVKDGRIVALAEELPRGASEIDASGLLVLPGGIDSHVHFAQSSGPGIVMADGFETGTRSAAAGGNTTVLSFALQPRGQSLRQSVEDYHKKAEGQSYIDYGFHLIVTDPTPALRLSVVQGVHDLRRYGSDRPPIARSVYGRSRTGRARHGPRGRL